MKINNHLKIEEIMNKKIWEDFNLSVSNPSYFQSWNWGEVQKKAGVDVTRLGFFDKSTLFAIVQIFDIHAKRGHFLHIRQGPVIRDWNMKNSGLVLNYIKEIADKKGATYIRINPLIEDDNIGVSYLYQLGFRESPVHNVDAENRWVLNLTGDNELLLGNMRKTTRYMIKKAQNMKINIVRSQNLDDVKTFLSIYNDTAKLKKFIPHILIKEEFEEFKKDGNAYIYLAKLNGKNLCGALISYYGNEAIYRHGATNIEGRNTPASYLLQWQAIKDAKSQNLKFYNFWGISKDDNPKNPWFGLTQFKKGFGGERKDFVHSMDYHSKIIYWLSYFIDYYTKIRKGYVS